VLILSTLQSDNADQQQTHAQSNWRISAAFSYERVQNTGYTLKLNPSHYTPRRRLGERRYSSYSFSTSTLDGGEWSASSPGRVLDPGKGPPISIVQEAGCAPEPVWTQRLEEKSSCLCQGWNLDRPVVQSVVRHYTD
jgi:hypothetical protein